MLHTSDEAGLEAEAEAVLGEPVVAAGMFGFQNLLGAEMVGGAVGAGMSGALGAGIGGILMTKAAAADQGATVKLIVAVTADQIHVLRWGHDADPTRVIRTLDRATTTVDVRTFGLSRIVRLTDPRVRRGPAAPRVGGAVRAAERPGPARAPRPRRLLTRRRPALSTPVSSPRHRAQVTVASCTSTFVIDR